MENAYEVINRLIEETKSAQRSAKNNASTMGRLLVGQLEGCDHQTLVDLKNELRRFNIQTGRWSRK